MVTRTAASRSSTSASPSSRAAAGGDVDDLPDRPRTTQAGTVLGTVGYMSPEQASGKTLDFRSDQFALGSILYEMATAKRAFQRGTTAETLTAIIRDDTEPVAQINPGVPAPFRWIVERCLQKDPEERYASTRDLARDVRECGAPVRGVGAVTEEVSGSPDGSSGPPPRAGSPSGDPRRESRSPQRSAPGCSSRSAWSGRCRRPTSRSPSGAARSAPRDSPRRPDDRLQCRRGSGSAQAFPQAPEPRLAPARSAEREPPVDLALRGDGDRHRLPLEPPRRLRGHARQGGADGRFAPRCRRRHPGGGLGARRCDADDRPRRRRQVAHRVPHGQDALRDLRPRQLRAAVAEGRPDRAEHRRREARPISPEGVRRTSRDRGLSGRKMGRGARPGSQGCYSAADGAARPVAGAAEDEFPVRFGADGRSSTLEARRAAGSGHADRSRERAAGGLEGATPADPAGVEGSRTSSSPPRPRPMPTRSRACSRISSSSRAEESGDRRDAP